MSLPKDHQQKNFSISVSYLWSGDCDYSKARDIEERTKYHLSVLMGFLVIVRFRGYDYPIPR